MYQGVKLLTSKQMHVGIIERRSLQAGGVSLSYTKFDLKNEF